jgi:hypothetical protein
LGSDKVNRIQELLTADRLGVRVIGRFASKQAAQAVETVLINWVYGTTSLSNISRGHGATFVRPKERPTEDLVGIDIERKLKVFGGRETAGNAGYLKRIIENHERNGHVAMADDICVYLHKEFPGLAIDEPCFWESGRYIAIFVPLVPNKVRMIIQLTDSKRNQHVYNLLPLSGSERDRSNFEKYMRENHENIKLQNHGSYGKLPEWINLVVSNLSLEEIAKQVRRAQEFFLDCR